MIDGHLLENVYMYMLLFTNQYIRINIFSQVYKSTGDIEAARTMFDYYSGVNDDRPGMLWASWRGSVLTLIIRIIINDIFKLGISN